MQMNTYNINKEIECVFGIVPFVFSSVILVAFARFVLQTVLWITMMEQQSIGGLCVSAEGAFFCY